MHRLPLAFLLGLSACAVQAAEPPSAEPAANSIMVLRGQWNYLNASVAFCVEKTPAKKAEFAAARDHAENEMRKAEDVIAQEAADERDTYQPLLDMYTKGWIDYAARLMVALQRQDAGRACPDLLNSWQITDVDLILEDWRGFMERSGVAQAADQH